MPGEKSVHTSKWDRCVKKVKAKGSGVDPYAVCSSSIKDAGVKKSHQRRDKMGYYANRKKAKKNENIITKFEDFINESVVQIGDSDVPVVKSIGIKNGLFFVSIQPISEFGSHVSGYKPYKMNVEELKNQFEKIGSINKFQALTFLKKEANLIPGAGDEISWKEKNYGIVD